MTQSLMKILLGICFFLLVAACATPEASQAIPAASRDEAYFRDAFSHLPKDAHDVVERLAACSHLSGEYGGDNSMRDQEVGAGMAQLRCQTLDRDVHRIGEKYPGNDELTRALREATEL